MIFHYAFFIPFVHVFMFQNTYYFIYQKKYIKNYQKGIANFPIFSKILLGNHFLCDCLVKPFFDAASIIPFLLIPSASLMSS